MRPNDPAESSVRLVRGRKARVFAITALALAAQASLAQGQGAAGAGGTAASDAQPIVITGTRIKSLALSSTSPVSQVSAEQIGLLRANTVEDFSAKLPQLAGGVLSTAAGSDAFGAQTLDLRNLGQNRTLVLINGTRAVPFSFRNAVDVNFVPAPLIERVDLLTGGAAAVYDGAALRLDDDGATVRVEMTPGAVCRQGLGLELVGLGGPPSGVEIDGAASEAWSYADGVLTIPEIGAWVQITR